MQYDVKEILQDLRCSVKLTSKFFSFIDNNKNNSHNIDSNEDNCNNEKRSIDRLDFFYTNIIGEFDNNNNNNSYNCNKKLSCCNASFYNYNNDNNKSDNDYNVNDNKNKNNKNRRRILYDDKLFVKIKKKSPKTTTTTTNNNTTTTYNNNNYNNNDNNDKLSLINKLNDIINKSIIASFLFQIIRRIIFYCKRTKLNENQNRNNNNNNTTNNNNNNNSNKTSRSSLTVNCGGWLGWIGGGGGVGGGGGMKNNISLIRIFLIIFLWIIILPTIFAYHQDNVHLHGCPGCPKDRDHHLINNNNNHNNNNNNNHHHHHHHNYHHNNNNNNNNNNKQQQQQQQQKIYQKNGGGFEEKKKQINLNENVLDDNSYVRNNEPSQDDLRLEAIKHQILTKLGLRGRPDVNKTLASVPRHLALKTLYRAEAQPQPLAPSFSQSASASASSSSSSSSFSSSGSTRNHQQQNVNNNQLHSNPVYRHRGIYNNEDDSHDSYGEYFYGNDEFTYKNIEQSTEKSTTILKEGSSSTTPENSYPRIDKNGDDDDDHRDGHVSEGENSSGDSIDQRSRDEQPQEELDDFYARTSEIITFAEPGHTLNGQPLLEFPMSAGEPVLGPLRVKKATLWARVELRHAHHYQHHRPGQNHQRNITLWVFRVRCGNATHLRGKELGQHLDMVTSLGVNIGQLGWQKFDVSSVVMDWYSSGSKMQKEKLTLLVDCTGCGLHVHVSTFGHAPHHDIEPSINTQGADDPDRPFLVVHTDPTGVKRIRRRAVECSGPLMGQCCKQRFYVNFTQLGWDDWIIAPQGYYANYCRGDCGTGHRTPDTFLNYYTHVIEEYRKMDRLAGMQPCCAPLKFSSISLIYYGPDSNIIKRDLPKMVVDECGCP